MGETKMQNDTRWNGSAADEPKELGFSQHPIQVQWIDTGYFWGPWSWGLVTFVESRSVTVNFSAWQVSKRCLLGWIKQGPTLCTHLLFFLQTSFLAVSERGCWVRWTSCPGWGPWACLRQLRALCWSVTLCGQLGRVSWEMKKKPQGFFGRCLIPVSWYLLSSAGTLYCEQGNISKCSTSSTYKC